MICDANAADEAFEYGGTNQKWNVNRDGTIVNVSSGLCLDAYNAAHANGTKLVL